MKEKRFVLPALAIIALSVQAAEPALLIHSPGGTSTSVALSQITKMKPESDALKIVTADGEQAFAYDDIVNLTFDLEGSWDGVMDVDGAATEVSLKWDGVTSTATVTGLAAGTQVLVFDLSGRSAASLSLPDDGTVDLSALARGIYIINIHNKSFKIAKQ